ncbi:MAG TPA: zinc ribbon domain-containing protein [Blastocatellia bacterium]|nr:zinc ribbon domain-containing protein [Blastocatellia bacterium]
MFCPRCANQIADNQNYCRNCGLNVGVIVEAIQDKPRNKFDFEPVIRGLHDLGSSLRAGWEEAHNSIKNTRKLNKNAPPQDWSREIGKAVWSREVSEVLKHHINRALKKAKAAHSRKHSFQQATLSILGGGAMMAVWYYVLEAVTDSGLLQNLQTIILNETGTYIDINTLVPMIRMLWMLGLIPVARGVAHLINGIFFAPKPEKEPELQIGLAPGFAPDPAQLHIQPPPVYVSAVADPATNNLESERAPQTSVTEDQTLRFEAK